MHTAFILKSADGKTLASASEITSVQGDLVHSRLTFHFSDGSLDDEQTVFTQSGVFHLLSDHHIQRGPAFPAPVDLSIDTPSGKVTWHAQRFGRDVAHTQSVSLPGDLANGIMPLLVENFPPGASQISLAWLAIALKPLVIAVTVQPVGTGTATGAGSTAVREYLIHPEIHGMLGFFAPLLDKEPGDIHIWVTDEKKPAFVRLSGPFFVGGPIWTVEPVHPAPLQVQQHPH